jgi:hypothetical protein
MALVLALPGPAFAAPGDLDTGFGSCTTDPGDTRISCP